MASLADRTESEAKGRAGSRRPLCREGRPLPAARGRKAGVAIAFGGAGGPSCSASQSRPSGSLHPEKEKGRPCRVFRPEAERFDPVRWFRERGRLSQSPSRRPSSAPVGLEAVQLPRPRRAQRRPGRLLGRGGGGGERTALRLRTFPTSPSQSWRQAALRPAAQPSQLGDAMNSAPADPGAAAGIRRAARSNAGRRRRL